MIALTLIVSLSPVDIFCANHCSSPLFLYGSTPSPFSSHLSRTPRSLISPLSILNMQYWASLHIASIAYQGMTSFPFRQDPLSGIPRQTVLPIPRTIRCPSKNYYDRRIHKCISQLVLWCVNSPSSEFIAEDIHHNSVSTEAVL